MSEVKSYLNVRVEEKKKTGAERLRTVMNEIRLKGVITEGELAKATGIRQKELAKYVAYLKENGLVEVKRRLMKDSEISLAGGARVPVNPKPPPDFLEEGPDETESAPAQEATQPPPQQEAPPQPKSWLAPPVQEAPQPEPEAPAPHEAPQPEPSPQQPPAAAPQGQQAAPITPPWSIPRVPLFSKRPLTAVPAAPSPAPAAPAPAAQTPVPQPAPAPLSKPQAPAPAVERPAAAAPPSPQPTPEPPKPVTSGEKIVPETAEELQEVAKSLVTDFVGVMRLYGEVDTQSYTAGLLIDKGNIIAVSFEHMDAAEIVYGDDAMRQIQSRFMGTKGDLEIFEMNEADLDTSLSSNVNYLISAPVKLSSLRIKIKSKPREPEPAKKGGGLLSGITGMFSSADRESKEDRQKQLKDMQSRRVEKIKGGFNLVDFARNLKIDPNKARRFEELRKQISVQTPAASGPQQVDPVKAQRLAQLRAQRPGMARGLPSIGLPGSGGPMGKEERMNALRNMVTSLRKPSPPKEDKVPVKTVAEGKKIETNIDKFYELVEHVGRVKINDALALKLKVSKTQIEEWAMILEEHNLLELHYPTIGEPEIISLHPEKAIKKEDPNVRKK